jgi:hypothetical protein
MLLPFLGPRQLNQVATALQRDLQAARCSAQRAHEQFDQIALDNRPVADALERQWNQALICACEIKTQTRRDDCAEPAAQDLYSLTTDIKAVWNDAHTDMRLKKPMLSGDSPPWQACLFWR